MIHKGHILLYKLTSISEILLLCVIVLVSIRIIVMVKNHIRGKPLRTFTMPSALKFVQIPLIIRCSVIWAVLLGILLGILFIVCNSKLLMTKPLTLVIGSFGMAALLCGLSAMIFLALNCVVSALLCWRGVRSASLILLVLLPIPFIAFIGPCSYLFHNLYERRGVRIVMDLFFFLLALPGVIDWGIKMRRQLRLNRPDDMTRKE